MRTVSEILECQISSSAELKEKLGEKIRLLQAEVETKENMLKDENAKHQQQLQEKEAQYNSLQ